MTRPDPIDVKTWFDRVQADHGLLENCLQKQLLAMEQKSASLNAFTSFDRPDAEAQLVEIKRRLADGEELPLAGLPVAIKDNIHAVQYPTTCGSKMLADYRPPFNAHVVDRLRHAGAVIFGKTNMDEFAMGSSNEFSSAGPVRNPVDTDRVPGGSSGGSAAAVAAGIAPLALGSDTGGSIRQPAAFCGVVGMKPTYGRVSRYGLVAYASSLDQVGPFATSVDDAEALFTAIAGHDERDSTSRVDASYHPAPSHAGPLKIGVIREARSEGVEPAVQAALDKAIAALGAEECDVVDVSIPDIGLSVPAYYVIATAEASANLARYDGIEYGHRAKQDSPSVAELYAQSREEGFGAEVKRRIMLGTFSLASGYYDAYYGRAMKVRALLRQQINEALKDVDLLMCPTTPTTAFKIGAKTDDPLQMYLNDIFTIIANLTEVPAISVPAGLDDEGLPIGMQFMAKAMNESVLFEGARRYERCISPS